MLADPDTEAAPPSAAEPLTPARRWAVAVPFVLCTLIWSSTWLAIRGQLGAAPPEWSVAYRFAIAALAMLGYAAVTRARLRFSAREHGFAILYGVAQYGLNYHAVYLAERTVTSGLVAVLFALLVVPNALLARIFLGQSVSRPFLIGSAVAMAGMAALFAHELAAGPAGHAALAAGIGWSLAGVMLSSIPNVMAGGARARAIPIVSLVAWGMIWGALFDVAVAAAIDGPPRPIAAAGYWLGTAYLGVIGSSLAFTLYFKIIREIGPARAAYTSVLSPGIAMLLSTLFEGYRWTGSAVFGVVAALGGLAVALRSRQSASPAR